METFIIPYALLPAFVELCRQFKATIVYLVRHDEILIVKLKTKYYAAMAKTYTGKTQSS